MSLSPIDQAISQAVREINQVSVAERMIILQLTPENGYTDKNTSMKSLELANTLVDDKVFKQIAKASVVSQELTITIPPGRYDHCSRGKGWVRKGKGDNAEWGESVRGGYVIGPGTWTQGSSDGFNRKEQKTWTVKHIKVGNETWTLAES